jgi:hypothetical protein
MMRASFPFLLQSFRWSHRCCSSQSFYNDIFRSIAFVSFGSHTIAPTLAYHIAACSSISYYYLFTLKWIDRFFFVRFREIIVLSSKMIISHFFQPFGAQPFVSPLRFAPAMRSVRMQGGKFVFNALQSTVRVSSVIVWLIKQIVAREYLWCLHNRL